MATYKDILELVDKVSTPLKNIQKNVRNTQTKFENFKGRINQVGQKFQVMGEKIKRVGRGLAKTASLIVGAVVAIGSAVLRGAKQVADYGDRIDKMSQKIGMSRKSFQEWDYIMSQNGGNVESLQMGFKTLTTQIDGVRKGSKESINAFKSLGVVVKDNNGQFRNADDIFNDTVRALQKVENPTQKMILANKLFGRSAAELRPLLNQEAEAVDLLREKANKMGLIISGKDIDNARDFKDTMDTFSRVFQAKFASVMMKAMPSFIKGLEQIMQIVEENQEVFDNIGIAFQWLVATALPAVIRAIAWIGDTLKKDAEFIGDLLGTIVSIPIYIGMAFDTLRTKILITIIKIKKAIRSIIDGVKQIFITVVQTISDWVAKIIEKITWIISKIPGINRLVENKVTQTQNNNTTNNNTSIVNNYGNTMPTFTSVGGGLYVW